MRARHWHLKPQTALALSYAINQEHFQYVVLPTLSVEDDVIVGDVGKLANACTRRSFAFQQHLLLKAQITTWRCVM